MKLAQEVLVLNFSQNIFFNYILGKKKKKPCATCYAQKYRFLYGRNCSSTVGQPKSCRAIVLQQFALLLKEFVKTNCFIKQIIILNLSFLELVSHPFDISGRKNTFNSNICWFQIPATFEAFSSNKKTPSMTVARNVSVWRMASIATGAFVKQFYLHFKAYFIFLIKYKRFWVDE